MAPSKTIGGQDGGQKKIKYRLFEWIFDFGRIDWNRLPVFRRIFDRDDIFYRLRLLQPRHSMKGEDMKIDEKENLKKLVFTLAEIYKNHFTGLIDQIHPRGASQHEPASQPSGRDTQPDPKARYPNEL